MKKSILANNMMNLMMKRGYACCFNYVADGNESKFEANFDTSRLYLSEYDPIRSMLVSDAVFGNSKAPLADYYSRFRAMLGTKAVSEYFEDLIDIKFETSSEPVTVCVSASWDSNEDGIIVGYTGYIVSISGVVSQIEKKLVNKPKPNPFSVDEAMKIIHSPGKSAVVQFDIKNFKHINQTYGEEIGDKVLSYIASNIEKTWGRPCVGCRLGADIFNIFTKYESKEELEMHISLLTEKLQTYKNISYKFYFGIYIVEDTSVHLRKMTDYAALARRCNRDNALNYINYYTPQLSDMMNLRREIEAEMETALETGQFKVYLQPKVRISDGKIIGAEALVRWIHPEKGIIPPNEFVPIFEKNGFIKKLDLYMHRQVCALIRKWIDMGIEPVSISANVSQAYLCPGLPGEIKAIADEYNVPLDLFQIEITESYQNRQVELCVDEFKSNGFTLLMDDFGSGYSSLNTLSNTRFDIIKLDRGFLGSYMKNERCKKVVTHTMTMVGDIGLGLVAEGVETKEQAEFLNGNGCSCAQGFLYSRPVPIGEFEKMAFSGYIRV